MCELNRYIYGKGDDKIFSKENVYLNYENIRSAIKNRGAISDNTVIGVIGITKGHPPCAA